MVVARYSQRQIVNADTLLPTAGPIARLMARSRAHDPRRTSDDNNKQVPSAMGATTYLYGSETRKPPAGLRDECRRTRGLSKVPGYPRRRSWLPWSELTRGVTSCSEGAH